MLHRFPLLINLSSNPPSSPLEITFSNSAITSSYGLIFEDQVDSISISVQ